MHPTHLISLTDFNGMRKRGQNLLSACISSHGIAPLVSCPLITICCFLYLDCLLFYCSSRPITIGWFWFCYYLLFLVLLLLLFWDCFGLFFRELRVFWNDLSISEVGVGSVYTLPSPDPTLCDYTGYIDVEKRDKR